MTHRRENWGDWVVARSRHVGFLRNIDLAAAVGCTPERITQWSASKVPPRHMRKGFDQKLAYALQTTKQVLFTDWKTTAPDQADRVIFHSDQLPLTEKMSWSPDLQQLLQGIIPHLAPSEQEQELMRIVVMITDKGPADSRYEMAKAIMDRFKLVEHFERTGERLPVPPDKVASQALGRSHEKDFAEAAAKFRNRPKTNEPWPN